MLAKIRHYVPIDTLKSIYFSIFNSHLIYGLQIWCMSTNTLKSKITTLQNKALRIINFRVYREHANPLYNRSKILKLDDYCTVLNCMFTYDIIKNHIPTVFTNFVCLVKNTHSHNTRQLGINLTLPITNTTTYGSNSIASKCASDWNKMQHLLKTNFQQVSRPTLKTMLHKHFLDNYLD